MPCVYDLALNEVDAVSLWLIGFMGDSIPQAPSVSIIVPVLNEQARLPSLLNELRPLDAQQIIVDGGSNDNSRDILQNAVADNVRLIITQSPRGRARQMNAGAELATGDILLFLHADTTLPEGALAELVGVASKADHTWGRFDVCFNSHLKSARLLAFFINLRSRVSGVATGDQAMFFSRSLFDYVGGFDQIELMEDVAMSKKCRRRVSGFCSRMTVMTSARRWEQNGVLRTILQMWWYRLAYVFGVSPATLLRGYRNIR